MIYDKKKDANLLRTAFKLFKKSNRDYVIGVVLFLFFITVIIFIK